MNNSNSTKSFKPVSTIATTNPQFIGFNLADFSLTPVVKKGKSAELVNTRNTHTWTSTVSGRKREFFIERKYGDVAPNSYTEDFLILLATMAFQRDNPTKIPVSATSLLTVQGYTSLPGGDNIHRVFDHLEALTETRIHTNSLYDREKGSWYSFKGSPVGGFTYTDEEGKLRNTEDKNGQIVQIKVRELGTASITPEFYEAFLQDCIRLDLTKYFNVGGPTARRLYKMGMKYVQTLGDFEIDLQECCLARLGMLPNVVLIDKVSKLAGNIRTHAQRVTEADDFTCVIEKSQTPSGYKVCFRKNVTQTTIPGLPPALIGTEKKAYSELVKRKVNKSLAYDLVVEARRRHGRRAFRFISFILKIWDNDSKVGPGVLKERIMNPVFFDPAFADYLQAQRVREGRKDSKSYAEGVSLIGDLFGDKGDPIIELKELAPDTLNKIEAHIQIQYSEENRTKNLIELTRFQAMRDRALLHYVEQTLTEIKKGNVDYLPFGLQ